MMASLHPPNGFDAHTLREEIANSVTHGVGAALSIAALSVLVSLAATRGDVWRVVSFSIYGATLVFLYLVSTLYHGIQAPRVKLMFEVIEHSAIYLLIAGTYTPFLLVTLRGAWGWSLFGVIWALAILGVVFKVFFIKRFRVFSAVVYVLMGWLMVIAIKPLLAALPLAGFFWLLAGGCAYTLGLAFFAWERLPYNHTIWHLFVMAGSICHFVAVLCYVLPQATGG